MFTCVGISDSIFYLNLKLQENVREYLVFNYDYCLNLMNYSSGIFYYQLSLLELDNL